MDRDDQPNNNNHGSFHHLLDPHLGEAIGNLVRGLLPQHQPQPQPTDQSPPASEDAQDFSDLQPPESTIRISRSGTSAVGAPSGSGTSAGVGYTPAPSSSNISLPVFHATTTMSSPQSSEVDPSIVYEDVTIHEDNHDVDMDFDSEPGLSSQPSHTTSDSSARSTRRTRVEDDEEDEDDLRASNRQRRHSTVLDDEHRYMPVPEDHGVPHASRDIRAPPQPNAPAAHQQDPVPPPQLNGMTWTFDFIPIRGPRPATNAQAPEGEQPATEHADHHHNHHQPGQQHGQGWNLFINFQNPEEGPAPQPGGGGGQDGGNQPGPGFGFPFPPFVFPFGMDFLEQRDDPERAQRLVKGLEDVPAGLVKRMERAGGPGTGCGQVPTCAVCWESLLDPEGGGFEGNAELARAEAAEAAEAAREPSISVDDTTPAMESSASQSSSSQSSQAEEASSTVAADGDTQRPRIVVLPCAHAFHATCLLPWFSKPGRTTCPSCRFDIDPDSLTYKPPPLRPLRTHPQPQPAPTAAAGPQPEGAPAGPAPAAPQFPNFFGPLPPPPFFHFPGAPQPPPAPAPPMEAQNAPNPPHAARAANQDPQPEREQIEPGQQRQPLPPFVTFDISMIIPIFPGRNRGAAPPNNGAQAPNGNGNGNAAPTDPQGPQQPAAPPPPPPPRTDNNGFRFDDTLLQEAVRTTFERLLGRPLPPFVPHPPPPGAPAPGNNGNGNNNNNGRPQWFTFSTGPLPAGFPPMPPLNMPMPPPAGAGAGGAPRPRANVDPRRPVEKRPWAPPPAPGPTLRQVVERNEREMGLRCSDVSCGLGPSDEEPDPASSPDPSAVHQIAISAVHDEHGAEGSSDGKGVCEHMFHPACLVSAERVAGWGQEVEGGGGDVEVSCPVCRAHGVISRGEWEEGACALA